MGRNVSSVRDVLGFSNQQGDGGNGELVTGETDGRIRFWNSGTGELVGTLVVSEGAVAGFVVRERHVVSAGVDRRTRV